MKKHEYKHIISVDAGFKAEGLKVEDIESMFSVFPEKFRAAMISSYKQMVVKAAINGPYVPNYKNRKEKKWFPLWWVKDKEDGSSGVGLSLNACGCDDTYAVVGARQILEDEEKCAHYAENFKELDEESYS